MGYGSWLIDDPRRLRLVGQLMASGCLVDWARLSCRSTNLEIRPPLRGTWEPNRKNLRMIWGLKIMGTPPNTLGFINGYHMLSPFSSFEMTIFGCISRPICRERLPQVEEPLGLFEQSFPGAGGHGVINDDKQTFLFPHNFQTNRGCGPLRMWNWCGIKQAGFPLPAMDLLSNRLLCSTMDRS
jgi:hypothetical protein